MSDQQWASITEAIGTDVTRLQLPGGYSLRDGFNYTIVRTLKQLETFKSPRKLRAEIEKFWDRIQCAGGKGPDARYARSRTNGHYSSYSIGGDSTG
jgi:hypothetical protein